MIAAIAALKALKEQGQTIENRTSSNCLRALTERLPVLRQHGGRGADGERVKNAEFIKMLDELLEQHQVRWRWASAGKQVESLVAGSMMKIAAGSAGRTERRYRSRPDCES